MSRKSDNPSFKSRDFHFEIKAVNPDGFFSGYGSVFGVVDSYQEVVAAGAFTASLAARAAKGRKLPILWQHRSDQPLGVYDVAKEDGIGLYLEGRLLIGEVVQAKEAHALMKVGALTGLSIGYYVRADSWDEKTRIRTLNQLDLEETSLVTFPANDAARIDSVKSRVARGDDLSQTDFEHLLRDSGFSPADAKSIANSGYQPWLSQKNTSSHSSVLQALQSIKFTT